MRFENIEKVLLLVPHQDDEIAVAGSLIYSLRQQGKEVYVCYATNGDYEISVDVRYKEACEALELLGVAKDHIIMLGYPDTSNEDGNAHIFYYDEHPLYSKAGHDQTYGSIGFSDYAYGISREHHPYTRSFYQMDVKSVICNIRPEFIVCVDLDHHVDHRMLSLTFDKVMGEILKENGDYCPKVWKGFAYGTSFSAIRDYWQINMNQTIHPQTRLIHNVGRLDNPFYDWEERVRVPVNSLLYTLPIECGIIYKALEQHASQMAILFAETAINCDQVFWERRTDNLLRSSTVQTSSGDATPLYDFMLFDSARIHEVEQLELKGLWSPLKSDRLKEIRITLSHQERIEYIDLWGIGSKVEIQLECDDEIYKKTVQTLYGQTRFEFDPPISAKHLKLGFRYDEDKDFGIGEIEVFKPQKICTEIFKILVDDLMVDSYYTCFHQPILSIYEYHEWNLHSKDNQYVYLINEKKVKSLQEIRKWRYVLKKKIVVKAIMKNKPNRLDTVTIYHISPLQLLLRRNRIKKWIAAFELVKKKLKEEHHV